MILIIIAIILGLVILVWYSILKIKFNNKRAHKIKERNALITEYESLKEISEGCRKFNDWLIWTKDRSDLSDFAIHNTVFKVNSDTEFVWRVLEVLAIIFASVGMIILCICNIDNKCTYNIATEKTAMYQDFVDSVSDDRLAQGGYTKVVDWNNYILSSRTYQDSVIFGSHHLFDGDWRDVPLVVFNSEGSE